MKLPAIQIFLVVFAGQTIAAVLDPRNNAVVEHRGNDNGIYNYVSKTSRPKTQGPFHFYQNVDHQDPDAGTFLQRYWVKDTYYGWNGRESSKRLPDNCPIFLIIAGEESGTDSLSLMKEESMIIRMASVNMALVVLLEHRYFGESFPVEDLSDHNMKYLTIEQTLADMNHFATRGMGSNLLDLKPDKHPWVLIGGSYAGGLVSWALLKYENTFYAGYSSSGTVQAKVEVWEYWDVVHARMTSKKESNVTRVCASWVQEIIKEFDEAGENKDIRGIRRRLRMSKIQHLGDMADILSSPIGQYPTSTFHKYCKALSSSKDFQDALEIVGEWNIKELQVDKAPVDWSSYDPESITFTNMGLDSKSVERQWNWLRCNELGWFLTAPPSGSPIVSKFLTVKRELRQCSLYFPTLTSGMTLEAITQRIESTNERYGGFNKRAAKLIDVNGKYDPWRIATFRSPNSPEMYRNASLLIPGNHTQDMAEPVKGEMDKFQLDIQRIMTRWLKEWSPSA